MPNINYVAQGLDGEQIEAALTAIDGVISPSNNGKVLAIEDGAIVAKSASEWTDTPVLESLNATANGDYVPESGVDGFNSVHVAVPGAGNIQPLSVTENGTYTLPSGVDGYAPVTVNVSGGGISGVYSGTGVPDSSLGTDGDIYIRKFTVPSNINLVEYLQSTGTQFIRTGISVERWTSVVIDFWVEIGTPTESVVGSRTGSVYYGINISVASGNRLLIDYGESSNPRTEYAVTSSGWYVVKTGPIKTVNGKYITSYPQNSITTSPDILIFALNNRGTPAINTGSKIRKVVIMQGNTVSAVYLPAIDGNGTPCLYDVISGGYLYNAGSGDFLYGNGVQLQDAYRMFYVKVNGTWVVNSEIGTRN